MENRDEKGRFAEGWKGGPGRPPKEQSLTETLREKVDPEEVANKLLSMALEKDDMAALKYIYDRVDGKPRESVDLQHSGEMTTKIVFDKELDE